MDRPKAIVIYERLAYGAIALTLLSMPFNWPTIYRYTTQHPIFYPLPVLAFFALQLWWVRLIAVRRKNWARWISLVVVVSSIPFSAMDGPERFRIDFAAAALYYAIGLIWLIATWCLFTGRANDWFKTAPGRTGVANGAT